MTLLPCLLLCQPWQPVSQLKADTSTAFISCQGCLTWRSPMAMLLLSQRSVPTDMPDVAISSCVGLNLTFLSPMSKAKNILRSSKVLKSTHQPCWSCIGTIAFYLYHLTLCQPWETVSRLRASSSVKQHVSALLESLQEMSC